MADLTPMQRKILLEVYLLGADKEILVSREPDSRPVVMRIGEKRLASDQAHDALSALYSRGLLHQRMLNRFALTESGRQLAKLLHDSRN